VEEVVNNRPAPGVLDYSLAAEYKVKYSLSWHSVVVNKLLAFIAKVAMAGRHGMWLCKDRYITEIWESY